MKSTQDAANYGRGYPLRQCGVCYHYKHTPDRELSGRCSKVAGKISPYGLCDWFMQMQNPWGNRMPAQARAQMEQFYDAARGDASQA